MARWQTTPCGLGAECAMSDANYNANVSTPVCTCEAPAYIASHSEHGALAPYFDGCIVLLTAGSTASL